MDYASLGNTCVVGLQWGDEGKGKIVDVLTEHFDVVVRYSGGANAGHTVRLGEQKFALHLLPSGILRRGVTCVIAPGVVVDPDVLIGEIDGLVGRGVEVGKNLLLSSRAHVVMPWHKKQDRLSEGALGDERKIGTTARGIGPCYADKMLRTAAVRVEDLYKPEQFRAKVAEVAAQRNKIFAALFGDREPLESRQISSEYLRFAERLRPFVTDTTPYLHDCISDGGRMLFEGAQGTLLDVDHGTYPYVTSSNCGVGGVASGSGVPPRCVKSVVGVMKAYCTRVGSGPFPTEQDNETGQLIRERGHEYGTTTGRPRRCGWFDAVAARYCVSLGGVTQVALMHLDTLATIPEVRICTGYRLEGRTIEHFVPDCDLLGRVEPVFETYPGWGGEISGITSIEQLPAEARRYVERLEGLLGAAITLVSVGADRTATLHRTSHSGAN